ncbi:MAG: hypothetical protein GTO67_14810, partial [Gammaproteobacteria bacterium]|nr:hypothetical protein [Gammaproteobacteria bacterium]NIT17558.1 hypothetical protein [Gammaproteobacteria bacterium]
VEFASHAPRNLEANPRLKDPARALREFLEGISQPVLYVADSAGRREVFLEFLNGAGIRPSETADLSTFRESGADRAIAVAPLEQGLWTDDL